MDEYSRKKNILDLQFQKYLIVASTAVVIAFTYIIGAVIAILAEQIRLDDFVNLLATFIVSFAVLGTCAVVFFNAAFHLRNIPRIIRNIGTTDITKL